MASALRGAREAIGLAQDRGRHAVAAPVGLDRQSPEASDPAAEQEAAGADHAPAVDSHDVRGLGVAAVAVRLERHALLLTEDTLAQLERGGELVVG